jgi:Calcineurin-like phosphoesterase
MKFDLISDLHLDFWPEEEHITWDGLGTSLIAVVLGDVSFEFEKTYKTIVDISKHYKFVIFVEGNHEHNNHCGIQEHNRLLKQELSKYQNICYLNRSAIVVDGFAFVGANGWWTFDFMEPEISREDAYMYFLNNNIFSEPFMHEIYEAAADDARIMSEIVARLTVDPAVSEIVLLTHTAPLFDFKDLQQPQHPAHYARCGSSHLKNVIDFDVNGKVKTWCFGHVHQNFDEVRDNIRYVCHPRGRKDDSPNNVFYYPKRIDLDSR